MNILLLLMNIFIVITLCFCFSILLISLSKKKKEKKDKIKREIFEQQIIDYAFSDLSNNNEDKSLFFSKKQKGISFNNHFNHLYVDPIFIEKSIEIINSLEGNIKKELILNLENLRVSEFILKRFLKNRNKRKKEFYLYQMGEIRSRKYLEFILTLNIDDILKDGLFRGYFFALNSIVNQWIYELPEETIKNYIDKVYEVLENIEKNKTINVQKFLEIFLIDTNNFFKYLVTNEEIRNYMIKNLFEKNISLTHKGEIIYIIVLNHEYRVFEIVKEEADKYFSKPELDHNELNYLILLTKAAGEIGIDEVYDIIKKACISENWVLKTVGAKYLYKYNKEESLDILYKMTFHLNWWVRYNASLSLEKMEMEGLTYLMKILLSEDKFAREIAAYVLVNGSYYSYVREMLLENHYDLIKREIFLLINKAGSINLVDKIIDEPKISQNNKIKIIEEITIPEFIDYYENVLLYKNVSEEILNVSKSRTEQTKKEA